MSSLAYNQYGKSRVRLTQVLRDGTRHDVKELAIKILFRGAFEESYKGTDNSKVLPTDTMKNTVYVLARQKPVVSIEQFALNLSEHFLDRVPHVDEVEIEIEQLPWARIEDHASAFVLAGQEHRFTTVTSNRGRSQIISGVRGLEILKTADSAFDGFLKDDLTTLPETRDRLLGTVLDADWTYRAVTLDFNAEHEFIRSTLLRVFAKHRSESVQHTLYEMANIALQRTVSISEVHLVLPNKHRLLVNLDRFGLDNPNQIFIPTDEPSGFIEARLRAD